MENDVDLRYYGLVLKTQREMFDLSVSDLSTMSRVSQMTILCIEKGLGKNKEDFIESLTITLGLTMEQLHELAKLAKKLFFKEDSVKNTFLLADKKRAHVSLMMAIFTAYESNKELEVEEVNSQII
ncbi:MAG: hypothetical protein PHE54_01355 [Bacilli bacterium]|nr:hypothetical protein [Bacilli bacterium]